MTNEIYITVIIPTYKPKEYLWDCLNSFMNQTFSKDKFEVVLVLNGCKEPYNSDILSYINTHSYVNINYIQTDVGGVSYARNIGIDKAKGTYITFVDDDDLVSECYLSELFQISSQDTIGLAYPYAFNDGHLHTQLSYSLTKEYEKCSKIGQDKVCTCNAWSTKDHTGLPGAEMGICSSSGLHSPLRHRLVEIHPRD